MTAPAPRGRVAWFHCFAGIAGDMALGALVDAGADPREVTTLLRRVPITGWDLAFEQVLRGGIACTRATVTVTEPEGASPRTHADVARLVNEAKLPPRAARRALATFRSLVDAEARLHGTSADEVHLHEVGAHDAVVDVVGTACALEVLDISDVRASAVATGTGTVGSAHGTLPNPPPAVLRLLEGVPAYGRPVAVELTTPTGAALLRSLASSYGAMPSMTVLSSGYGAGQAELDELPNCTQVVVGDLAPGDAPGDALADSPGAGQPVVTLEANLDDATGEQLAEAVASLLDAGAYDAWITPAVMKKGRPGQVLHALCDPAAAAALRRVVRATTGTFGVRATPGERWPGARRMAQVTVTGEQVRMKVGHGRAKPEADDVARVARVTGLPLHEVASRAEEAWRRRSPPRSR